MYFEIVPFSCVPHSSGYIGNEEWSKVYPVKFNDEFYLERIIYSYHEYSQQISDEPNPITIRL